MIKNAPHYTVGHKNPDSDTVVSAYVLAWLHNKLNDEDLVTPLRLGKVNKQTEWIFKQAQAELPTLRESCLYYAHEVAKNVPKITIETPLREALEMMQKADTSFVAVVNSEDHPIGIVSDRTQRTNYLLQCNIEDFIGTLLDFAHIVKGLPLTPLKPEVRPQIEHIQVAIDDLDNKDWENGTAVIIGKSQIAIDQLIKNPPDAVIVTEADRIFADDINEKLECPVYYYSGSLISMLIRLPGCFPASAALVKEFVSVDKNALENEFSQKIKESPWGLMVVDETGKVFGSISAMDIFNTPRPKISLVDHSEKGQSIDGLQEAEVQEIIDHHRLGDIETIQPLRMDVRPLGSTASILYDCIVDANLEIPTSIAKLLLGALIADTLLLTSPTCTRIDKKIAIQLAASAEVDLRDFGLEVLRQNDELTSASPEYLVRKDCKSFTYDQTSFLASQIETVDLCVLDEQRMSNLKNAFGNHVLQSGVNFGILMITDVIQSKSKIIIVSDSSKWEQILVPEDVLKASKPWIIEQFVSRKKQLIPLVLKTIKNKLK